MSKITETFKNMFTVNDDYDDDYYDDYEDDYEEPVKEKKNKKSDSEYSKPQRTQSQRKIVPMKKNSSGEVRVIKPTSYDDAREVAEILLSGRVVFLNLEGLHMELAQRIIDFVSGAAFSVDGKLEKVSSGYMYAITPHNVELNGDFADEDENGYEINPYKRL